MVLKAVINGTVINHGELFRLANNVRKSPAEHMSSKAKADYEKKQKEDSKVVRARFSLRHKGEVYNDIAHIVGPGEPIIQYRFIDGHVYEIPKGLAEKVNKEGKLPKRGQRLNDDGSITPHDTFEIVREFTPVGWE